MAQPGRRRRIVIGIGLGVLTIGGLSAWWAASLVDTYREAEALQADAAVLRGAVTDRDWSTVVDELPGALASAQALEESTQGVGWRVLESVPVIGGSATAVTDMAASVTSLLRTIEPLTPFADRLVEGQFRRGDGSVDLEIARDAAPHLARLVVVLEQEVRRLDRVDVTAVRPEIAKPVSELRDELRDIIPVVQTASSVATWLPALLGAEAPRTWLVLLQNPAEARGTGGFPGAYVTLKTDNGKLSVDAAGKSGDLNARPIPAEGAPEDARVLWGDYLTQWNTFNLSPNFPLAGSLAAAGMGARGEPVTGVVAVDPRTVAAMLAVTGPVTAGGQTITADNAERFFTIDSYATLPDARVRDATTIALVGAVLREFLGGSWDPVVLADALIPSIDDGRIRAWSAVPNEQEWLVTTPLGGSVPAEPGSVVAVAFNNAAGNKMDAFVATSVDYQPGRCATSPTQQSQLAITLRNDAPLGLPLESGNYGRADDPTAPEGSTKLLMHVYAPVGAGFGSATMDGQPLELYLGEEQGRPVWWNYITLERGQERRVEIAFEEPTVLGVPPAVLPQTMVIDEVVSVRPVSTCD